MKEKNQKNIRAALDAALLRKELREALEEGWLNEQEAFAIRHSPVPVRERMRRVRKARTLVTQPAIQKR
jgi:hypothetical protein